LAQLALFQYPNATRLAHGSVYGDLTLQQAQNFD